MPYVREILDKPHADAKLAADGHNPYGNEASLHGARFMKFRNGHGHSNEFLNSWENGKRMNEWRHQQSAWEQKRKENLKNLIESSKQKRIEEAGGVNWTIDDIKLASKWKYVSQYELEDIRENHPASSVVDGQYFSTKMSVERATTDIFYYKEWQKHIKTAKDFEGCEKDGKLDVGKVVDLLSDMFENCPRGVFEEIVGECGITTLAEIHQLFYECWAPCAACQQWISDYNKKVDGEADWYYKLGLVFCLCTMGVSISIGQSKVNAYEDEHRIRKMDECPQDAKQILEGIFKEHLLRARAETPPSPSPSPSPSDNISVDIDVQLLER